MHDANRIFAELSCPRCDAHGRMEVRVRYGPAGHEDLEPGDRIRWPRTGSVLGGPSPDPVLALPGQAVCPSCAALAAGFGRREFRGLRASCEALQDPPAKLSRRRDLRLAHLLAFFDYNYRLRGVRDLAGEDIGQPGRWIERTGEVVLGYSPVQFEEQAAVVCVERDVIGDVHLVPVALQDVLKCFPVSIYFGPFTAGFDAMARGLGEGDRAVSRLVDGVLRVALALELASWRAVLGDDAEGRLDLIEKLGRLLCELPFAWAELAALADLDRFSTPEEIDAAMALALGVAWAPADEGEDPAARLDAWLANV